MAVVAVVSLAAVVRARGAMAMGGAITTVMAAARRTVERAAAAKAVAMAAAKVSEARAPYEMATPSM